MSKRVNPHRRLLAAQATLRREAQAYGNADDAGKLQKGPVRSHFVSLDRKTDFRLTKDGVVVANFREPKSSVPDPSGMSSRGDGKPGKVVKGRFKSVKPGTKSRFSVK